MPGELILHYQIVKRLGEGGMGVVLLAEDTRLQRQVALKFPAAEALGGSEHRRQFLAEARAASALNHPNICTIHAVEEIDDVTAIEVWLRNADFRAMDSTAETTDETPYDSGLSETHAIATGPAVFIVMEYVRGESLAARLLQGPLDPGHVLDLAAQIAQGLGEAHARRITHRDIKPQNLMMAGPLLKIMDFGLARVDAHLQSGLSAGTPAYMSPEQIQARPLDERTDIFSTGVVLYELLTGQRPFAGADVRSLAASIANDEPMAPSELVSEVPRGLEQIVMRCLRKDPADRYRSADDLLQALATIRGETAEQALVRRQKDRRLHHGVSREGERRPATLLFGVLVPPEGAEAGRDEEQLSHDTSELIGLVTDVVVEHGGTVDQVVSGAFTALFGLPTAAEGSTRRALNAALAIRRALAARNRSRPAADRFALRCAVNTGTVLAVAIGSGDDRKYSVLGETVELAAAMRDAARVDQILVGAQTPRHAGAGFAFNAAPPVDYRGAKMAVWALASDEPAHQPSEARTSSAITASLVGRDRELGLLLDQVEALLGGRGAIVSIIGEPGVGKSRLVAELLRHEATRRADLVYARADSTGAGRGYHPFIHALKSWAGIQDHDPAAEARAKLDRLIGGIVRDDAGEVATYLGTMMGLTSPDGAAARVPAAEGEALTRLMVRSVRTLLESAAAIRPLIVVIEDLHWADQSSVDLIERLFRSAEQHPILFLCTSRPGYEATGGRVLETTRARYARFHVELDLLPLDAEQASRLLDALLRTPGLPRAVARTILKRAGGNPLFLEEVVRSLVADGSIEIADGVIRVTRAGGDLVVPDTIQELLVARVDLLDEPTRALLKVASVIGTTFLHRILTAVAPHPEQVEPGITRLLQAQLIRRGEGREGIEYAFNHALTQESVYATIVPRVRRDLHARVAAAIEERLAHRLNEFYAMLAVHYSCAEQYEKAEQFLTQAGDEAVKAAAPSEAIHYFQQALDLYLKRPAGTTDAVRTGQLENSIGVAYYNKGQMAQAVDHFDRALALWGAATPVTTAGRLATLVGDVASVLTRLYLWPRQPSRQPRPIDNAIIQLMARKGTAIVSLDSRRYFTESLSTMRWINRFDIRSVRMGAAIYATASSVFSIPGISLGLSRRILDYSKPYIDRSDPRALLYHRFPELFLDYLSGNWRTSAPYDPQIVDANARNGEEWFLSVYIVIAAALQTERGNYADAAALVETLGGLAETFENDLIRARRQLSLTRLLMKQRLLDRAAEEAARGVPLLQQIDHPLLLLYMYGLKANVELHRRDAGALEQTFRDASALRQRLGRVPPYYITNYLVARLASHVRDFDAALREGSASRAASSRDAARQVGKEAARMTRMNAAELPEVWRWRGVIEWLDRRYTAALAAWDRSRTAAERMGARPELARTYAEVARCLERGSGPAKWNGLDAAGLRAQARTWMVELGITAEE